MIIDLSQMENECTIEAYAKINIGLMIGAPLQTGYHPLLSIFHAVSLSDLVKVVKKPAKEGVLVSGDFDCPVEATTPYKAARLFMKETGIPDGAAVEVEKRVPARAGLGGGSADAAATLAGLNVVFQTGLGTDRLVALAAQIGADVPFFLYGGAAIVSGIGEVIDPLTPRTDFGVLLVYPGFGVSTQWAYRELDAFRKKNGIGKGLFTAARGDEKERIRSIFAMQPGEWSFANAFEDILFDAYPAYRVIKRLLEAAGALFVSVTGSGSCIYGIFPSVEDALGRKPVLESMFAAEFDEKTMCGMALLAIKPLETSLLLR